jgi:predicted transcriptional regulator
MVYELPDVKLIRKRLGLSQSQLAKIAGVSQSLIAKIEAGRIDPTFSKAKKIFAALDDLTHEKDIKAKDLMNPKIISCRPNDRIKDIIQKMKKSSISQMPVIDKDIVGFVSEASILASLVDGKRHEHIKEVMADVPPIIALDSTSKVVGHLLKHFPAVFVADKGKLKGVITKSDLLDKMI